MLSMRSAWPLVAALVSGLLPTDAILCYDCNSKTQPVCKSLKNASEAARLVTLCDVKDEGFEPFCRKMDIRVFNEHRVIRSCGWRRHTSPCYTVTDEAHQEVVCQCFSDLCNSTPSSTLPPTVALLLKVAVATYTILHGFFL